MCLPIFKISPFFNISFFLKTSEYVSLRPFNLIAPSFAKRFKCVIVALVVIITFVNLQKNPLLVPSQNQIKRTQEVAKFVIGESNNKPFNFALLSKNNYDAAYQFYLDIYGFHPKQVHLDITDQLFVVCEDKECLPVGHHKYEIAAFGWSKIEKETKIFGVKIFKLVHNPSGKP